MKKSEIKTGVVYAYATSKYQKPKPVIVIDIVGPDGTGWHQQKIESYVDDGVKNVGKRVFIPTPQHFSVRPILVAFIEGEEAPRSHRSDRVYTDKVIRAAKAAATVDAARSLRFEAYERERPASFSRDDQRTVTETRTRRTDIPGLNVTTLNDARGILGEWDDVMQDRDDEQQRRALLDEEQRVASAARVANAQRRVAALAAVGVTVNPAAETKETRWSADAWEPAKYTGNTAEVRLTLAQVDALLALIPDGARAPDPANDNVADDGWSYVHPDGGPA